MELLTILIPTYNEDSFILETLESLQNQTFKDFKCLISDNDSTDNTGKICQEFAQKDSRFTYIKQDTNIGSGLNTEFLVAKVQTEYTMIFSGHDVIEDTFLEKSLEAIINDETLSFVFSKTIGINEQSKIIDSQFAQTSYEFKGNSLSRYIQSIRQINNCTLYQSVFKTNLLDNYKFAHDTLGDDHIFISHLLWRGKLHIIDEVLYKRRFFQNRTTTSQNRVSGPSNEIKKSFYRMYEAYLENFNTLYKGPENFRTFLNNKILDILTLKYGISHLYDEDYIEEDLK